MKLKSMFAGFLSLAMVAVLLAGCGNQMEPAKNAIAGIEAAIAAAKLSLDPVTSVDVQQATLEMLLEQAAAPLGLTARRQGATVVIEPRK